MKTDIHLSSAEAGTPIHSASKRRLWVGRIMAAFTVLFLLVDGVMKLIKPPPVVHATVELGYPESSIIGLGIVLLACVVLYVIPKTSLLGTILLTGYLRWRCRDACASWQPAVHSHAISGLSRRSGLGRPFFTQSPNAYADSSMKRGASVNKGKSHPDGRQTTTHAH
jgi:hypothetical protein